MAGIKIAIVNASTVLKDKEVETAVPALQKQVSGDFTPHWGIDAELLFVPKGHKAPVDFWQLTVLDNSEHAGVLGYHDMTKAGQPLGKIFAGSVLHYGKAWTITASHELLEMLGDPNINLVAFSEGESLLYAYEVCDACESDQYAYKIDGILVSDFVYPGWFEPLHVARKEKFDFMGKISRPFGLLPGGFIGVYNIGSGGGWTQLTAPKSKLVYSDRAPVGSRRERRRTPKRQWLRSKI